MSIMKTIQHVDWNEFEKELAAKSGFSDAVKETQLEYQVARAIVEARIKKGMTQDDLARAMKTKQSVISRAENAKTIPTLSFLKRLAYVLDASLSVQFKFQ